MSLLPVADARARIIAKVSPVDSQEVALTDSLGRTLAEPVLPSRDQPPFRSSAMDGYAVRAAEANATMNDDAPPLRLAGASAAGRRFTGTMKPGETVRIFTGAPAPEEADAVLIQENTVTGDGKVRSTATLTPGANLRARA